MNGQIVGLDVRALLARPAVAHLDAVAVDALLTAGEAGALAGVAKMTQGDE